MEPIDACRTSRFSSYERVAAICLTLLAVVSPLYIDQRPVSDLELDTEPINRVSWLPLLLLVLILAITLSRGRSCRFSSYERVVAIGLTLLAVVSPLYINRRAVSDLELDAQPNNLVSWLPLLLLVLILAITLSLYLDQRFTRFDPYWIHRVGGSSGGIIVILMVLALVLKCKALWDA